MLILLVAVLMNHAGSSRKLHQSSLQFVLNPVSSFGIFFWSAPGSTKPGRKKNEINYRYVTCFIFWWCVNYTATMDWSKKNQEQGCVAVCLTRYVMDEGKRKIPGFLISYILYSESLCEGEGHFWRVDYLLPCVLDAFEGGGRGEVPVYLPLASWLSNVFIVVTPSCLTISG